jgi:glycosyltransferase involved in cell wall biosynthesis
MKIGVVTDYYPADYKPYYDAQFAQFIRDGHEITIMALDELGSASKAVDEYGLAEKTHRYPRSLRDAPRHALRVARQLIQRPRHVVRLAGIAARMSGSVRSRVTDWVRMLSLPDDPPDFWLIQNLPAGVMFPWLRQVQRATPVVLYFHGGEIPKFQRDLSASRVGALLDQCTVVFTNTQASKSQIVGRGCDPAKVVVLPVGFDLRHFTNLAPRTYRPDGVLRLVSAGRLSEEKGIHIALEALRELVHSGMTFLHYTIVGDGYVRPELERFVDDNGLRSYVSFRGVLSWEHTIREFEAADVLLLPSIPVGRWVETQACVVQEALLVGTPTITSAIGGVVESIPDSLREFSLPPGDARALAAAIRAMAALTTDDLRSFGAVGRDWVAARYDIETLNEQLIATATGKSEPAR